jgi:hypothetical protein
MLTNQHSKHSESEQCNCCSIVRHSVSFPGGRGDCERASVRAAVCESCKDEILPNDVARTWENKPAVVVVPRQVISEEAVIDVNGGWRVRLNRHFVNPVVLIEGEAGNRIGGGTGQGENKAQKSKERFHTMRKALTVPRSTVLQFCVALVLFCVSTLYTSAATNYPATPVTWATIEAAIGSSSDGDTVLITNATLNLSMTNKVTLLNGINLIATGTVYASNDVVTSGDPALAIVVAPNRFTRISGFRFQRGTATHQSFGLIQAQGTNTSGGYFRIDRCTFTDLAAHALVHYGPRGMVDNNTFQLTNTFFIAYNRADTRDGSSYGNGAWAAGPDWGGTNKVWFVSNVVSRVDTVYPCVDGIGGAIWGMSYNLLTNNPIEMHGTESGQDYRSTRATELIANTFHLDGAYDSIVNVRGGTSLAVSNVIAGTMPNQFAKLSCYRLFAPFTPWGYANGTNAWDTNTSGGPFLTVEHTGTNFAPCLINAASNWTPNAWAGYSLINTNTGRASLIQSNTATVLYFWDNQFVPASSMFFTNGQWATLWRVHEAIDMPGKGAGNLLANAATFETPAYPNQADDPVIVWGNTTNSIATPMPYQIRAGEHYTNGTLSGWQDVSLRHLAWITTQTEGDAGGSEGGGEPTSATPTVGAGITWGSGVTIR